MPWELARSFADYGRGAKRCELLAPSRKWLLRYHRHACDSDWPAHLGPDVSGTWLVRGEIAESVLPGVQGGTESRQGGPHLHTGAGGSGRGREGS